MLKSKLSAGIYLLLVFASGILVGGFSHRLYVTSRSVSAAPRNPDEWRKRYTDELRDKVRLDSQQVQQLEQILDETRQQYRDLREKEKPLTSAIQTDQVNKIRAMLRPDQKEAYEQVRNDRERRRVEAEKKKGGSRH